MGQQPGRAVNTPAYFADELMHMPEQEMDNLIDVSAPFLVVALIALDLADPECAVSCVSASLPFLVCFTASSPPFLAFHCHLRHVFHCLFTARPAPRVHTSGVLIALGCGGPP